MKLLRWNLIQNNIMLPPTQHYLVWIKFFDVKFSLLRLLQFLNDFKSTNIQFLMFFHFSLLFQEKKMDGEGNKKITINSLIENYF